MVSVVIPVYNVEEYLPRCMESVANQTYRDMEIILVNDASTDGSAHICDWWAETDSRVKVVHQQENKGHGEARNVGVAICQGEYLTFLDSDDWWESNFIEKMLEVIVRNNADLAVCDIFYEYFGETPFTEVSEIRLKPNCVYTAGTDGNIINTARTFLWGKIYKTDFYKSLSVIQPRLGFDDLAVVPYITSRADGIIRCPMPLYHYLRYRKGNTVDNFDNLYGVVDAMHILLNSFVTNGTYDFFYPYLCKLAFSQIRFAIRKIGFEKKEKYKELIVRLLGFMDENFPGWFNPYEKEYAVVGNEEQADIVRMLMFDDKQVHIVDGKDNLKRYEYVFTEIPSGISTQTEKWNVADRIYFDLSK